MAIVNRPAVAAPLETLVAMTATLVLPVAP